MFNIGFGEMLLLGIIALIFIGPEQLPQMARTLGRFLNELKRTTSDLQSTFTSTFTEDINRHLQGNPHAPHPNSYEQNPAPPESTQAQNAAPPSPAAADSATSESNQNTIHTPSTASTDKKENKS